MSCKCCKCDKCSSIPEVVTTTVEGILYSPMGDKLLNAAIITEITDKKGESVGLRSTTYTDEYGRYKFKLIGGYHNLYILPTPDGVEKYIGTVHVTGKDFDKIYTIKDLLI